MKKSRELKKAIEKNRINEDNNGYYYPRKNQKNNENILFEDQKG